MIGSYCFTGFAEFTCLVVSSPPLREVQVGNLTFTSFTGLMGLIGSFIGSYVFEFEGQSIFSFSVQGASAP